MRHRLLAAALVLAWSGPAAPGEPLRLAPPGDPAWESVALPGVERPSDYEVVAVEAGPGGRALRAEARCSASARVLRLPETLDLEETPLLRWSWRATRVSDAVPDETGKPGDDFAARVGVMFPFEPERAGWLARVRNGVAAALAGREVPGTTLYFVWSARAEPGSRWKSPYGEEIEVVVLERGESREWREAEVDVRQAYRDAFGRNPPRPAAVGLMTDSDNHCGEARADYGPLEFREAP